LESFVLPSPFRSGTGTAGGGGRTAAILKKVCSVEASVKGFSRSVREMRERLASLSQGETAILRSLMWGFSPTIARLD